MPVVSESVELTAASFSRLNAETTLSFRTSIPPPATPAAPPAGCVCGLGLAACGVRLDRANGAAAADFGPLMTRIEVDDRPGGAASLRIGHVRQRCADHPRNRIDPPADPAIRRRCSQRRADDPRDRLAVDHIDLHP